MCLMWTSLFEKNVTFEAQITLQPRFSHGGGLRFLMPEMPFERISTRSKAPLTQKPGASLSLSDSLDYIHILLTTIHLGVH